MFIGKYILVIFHSLFFMRNFMGTCSSVEMLKRYMARENLITPVQNLNPDPSTRGSFGGLSPPNKAPSPPNWDMKHYKSVECFQILECQAIPKKRKAPRRNGGIWIVSLKKIEIWKKRHLTVSKARLKRDVKQRYFRDTSNVNIIVFDRDLHKL